MRGFLVVLLLGASAASAQYLDPVLSFDEPIVESEWLVPGGPASNVTIPWTLSMRLGTNVLLMTESGLTMEWVLECGPGIVFQGERTTTIVPEGTPPRSAYSGNATFQARADNSSFGESVQLCRFAAKAEGPVVPSNEAVAIVPLTATFVGRLEVEVPSTVQVAPGAPAHIPIHVTNAGNAIAHVLVAVETDLPPEWRMVAPANLTIGRDLQDLTTLGFLTSAKEGQNDERLPVRVTLTPISTKDANVTGPAVVVDFTVHSFGLYCSDPEDPAPECEDLIDAKTRQCEAGLPDPDCKILLDARSSPAASLGALAFVALVAFFKRARQIR